jgi:hypothetical protein
MDGLIIAEFRGRPVSVADSVIAFAASLEHV